MQEFYLEMLLGSTQDALLGSICAEGKERGQDWTKGEVERGAVSAASADPTESPCLWTIASASTWPPWLLYLMSVILALNLMVEDD